MISRTILPLVSLLLLGAILAGGALAGTSWICSITEAVGVEEDGTVGVPDLGDLEQPTFFRVDAGTKKVTLLAPVSRAGEVTKIDVVHEEEGLWLFVGVEANRSWSMVIEDNGHLTLSITGDGATWSIFGSAMKEEK